MTGGKAILPTLAMALMLVSAGAAGAAENTWVTLGTHGGPMPQAGRSEPANALVVGKDVYLVDTGDGTAQQLAEAGFSLAAVKGIFISHLHFDHTGGLYAVLSLRHQTDVPGRLKIYGPPGMKETVDGLLAAMQPEAISGYGVPGADVIPPQDTVEVIEIRDGAHVQMDGFTVTAAENSHYSFPPGSDMDKRFDSLSFRFDLPERSIVYTGDTGPSDAVTRLAKGADLLISEMIDPRFAEAIVPNGPPFAQKRTEELKFHLIHHHISPEQLGEMAAEAKVSRLVVTHLVIGRDPNIPTAPYVDRIKKLYDGPVEIADDLDRF
jgi:ribonuclease BN (tRNA processing enzyme)